MRYALLALFCCSCCILGLTATCTPALAHPPPYDCFVIPDPETDDIVHEWYALYEQHHLLIDEHDASTTILPIHQTYPVWKMDMYYFAVEGGEEAWDPIPYSFYDEEYARVYAKASGGGPGMGDLRVGVMVSPPPRPVWETVIEVSIPPRVPTTWGYCTSAELQYDWTYNEWDGRVARVEGYANKPGCGSLSVDELWFGLYDDPSNN